MTAIHRERHFTASDAVRDVVIGMADGLTVPFALAAGLSGSMGAGSIGAGAIAAQRVVVTAGLAEIAAGAIAMGLGGYLAARTDIEHYRSEYRREQVETEELPDEERREVHAILCQQGLDAGQATLVVDALARDQEKWVRFMMRFELGLEEPDPRRAPVSAATIGVSYIAGGLVPLLPYMLLGGIEAAFRASILVTLLALVVFGGVKGRLTSTGALRSAVQTAIIGGLAAAAAYGVARAVGTGG